MNRNVLDTVCFALTDSEAVLLMDDSKKFGGFELIPIDFSIAQSAKRDPKERHRYQCVLNRMSFFAQCKMDWQQYEIPCKPPSASQA